MNTFRLIRASDPAAMPIGEPEEGDPWSLDLTNLVGHVSPGVYDVTFAKPTWLLHLDDADQGANPLESLLAFLAYLDTPIRITGNGRGVPTLEILDVP